MKTYTTKRATVPALEEILGETFKVHEHGVVRVVDYMGGDEAIVQMARVSYGEGTKTVNEDRGLIRYLMRHRHTSPIEGCEIKLHLKMPIFVARQWIRHRTASLNEVSARYSEMKDEFFVPVVSDVQMQSTTNKQGSQEGGLNLDVQQHFADMVARHSEGSFEAYSEALEDNIAREMSRIVLPLNLYTEFYWKIDLHNLLHFCSLRSDSHAQKEIRVYSDIILHDIIKRWAPATHEAFVDYTLEAKRFSRMEMNVFKELFEGSDWDDVKTELAHHKITGREADEFIAKLRS